MPCALDTHTHKHSANPFANTHRSTYPHINHTYTHLHARAQCVCTYCYDCVIRAVCVYVFQRVHTALHLARCINKQLCLLSMKIDFLLQTAHIYLND